MNNPFLTGKRLYMRPLEPDDARVLAACNNDPEVRTTFFTHTPTSIYNESQRIAGFYKPGADYIPFAICLKDDSLAIGLTAFHRVDLVSRAAVFSICLCDSAARGKGYAGDATRLMLQYGFDILNLHRIQLHVWTGNERAVRLYKECGFTQEGILREAMKHDGEYCDFYVMGILEDEWRENQET